MPRVCPWGIYSVGLAGTESVSAVDLLRTKDTRAGLLDYVEDLWEHDPHLSTALQSPVGRARAREAQGDVDVRKYPKRIEFVRA